MIRGGGNPLPQGTLSVGIGLVTAGVAQYGFLAIAAHALGPARSVPLATFWSLLFVCGPGFYLPLEQEVTRALAERRARGEGGRPLVERAAVAGSALTAVLVLATLLLSGTLTARLFNGDTLMVWAFIAGLCAFLIEHLFRGTLAGNSRFRPYGLLLGSEGVLRVTFCALLAVAGATVAGLFGFALVVASYAAVAIAVAGRRGLLRPGPHASWGELSRALGFLLVSSVLTQFLLSSGPVAVKLLATPSEPAAASRFLAARVLTFIPIFLLQAVQAPLLPKLTSLAAAGRAAEFRHAFIQLLLLVAGLGAAAVAGFALLGPFAAGVLFGAGFGLGHLDYALLAASCAFLMLAQVLNQTIVSLSGYPRATAGWLSGAVCFVAVTLLGSQLFLRVELGLVAGSLVSAAVMGWLLVPLLRGRLVQHP